MSLQRFKASELTRFLVEIDKNLEEAARITIIGGSAAALGYNVSATTSDIDTFASNLEFINTRQMQLGQRRGLKSLSVTHRLPKFPTSPKTVWYAFFRSL